MTTYPRAMARRARRLGAMVFAAATVAGCISGRVLEGYPGYPFLQFDTPLSIDSTFFAVQRAVVAEGFVLDFTERSSGAVNTRPADRLGREVFLSIVVGVPGGVPAAGAAGAGDTTRAQTRVWIAGYVRRRSGADRIDPLAEEAWSDLAAIAERVSERLGGTRPRGPPPAPG